jgi:hypothetical protein
MCIGFFYSANFGMEKECTIINIPQMNLYVERGSRAIFYQSINKYGCVDDLDDTTVSVLKLAKRFKGGSLTRLQGLKYCVRGKVDYASHVAVQREHSLKDTPLSLKNSDFCVPIELTEDQIRTVIKLRKDNKTVFVTDQYNARLDIASISVDAVKKEEIDRLQRHVAQEEDDVCNEKCLQSCEACCVSAILPVGTAVVLIALGICQAITG